jgi:hypothetical protein
VNPTEHTAKSASTPKTGRFASLGAPHRAPGSGASARSPIFFPRPLGASSHNNRGASFVPSDSQEER